MSEDDPSQATGIAGMGSIFRTGGAALAILLIVLVGVGIGGNIWPPVVKVPERVVESVRTSAGSRQGLDSLPAVVDRDCSAVVRIRATGAAADAAAATPAPKRSRKRGKGPSAAATPPKLMGFILTSDGYILTSASALPAGALEAVMPDGEVLPAERKGDDALSGLALLKVDEDQLATLDFADDGFPRTGQMGIALANPAGTGCIASMVLVSSDFLVTGPGRRATLQTSPALDPGFLAMPVLGTDGRVIAIANLDAGTGQASLTSTLLPAAIAARVAGELLRSGKVFTNAFGFEVESASGTLASRTGADPGHGAIVSLVQQGSPADKAGLLAGDVILAANGNPISSPSELARSLDSGNATTTLNIQRRSDQLTLKIAGGSAGS